MTSTSTIAGRALSRDLHLLVPDGVVVNAPMRALTRWRIGGTADYIVQPSSVNELSNLIRFLNKKDITWTTVGHTSNLLVSDEGIRGVLVQISDRMSKTEFRGSNVISEAGIWVPKLARKIGCAGLTGIEHIVGIPGTLGGLVCMNGGSMRRGIGENIRSVECIDEHGEVLNLSRKDCNFAYRYSIINVQKLTVASAVLELSSGDSSTIRKQMLRILSERRRKFPLKLPNCGSVFVSDPATYDQFGPPGAILERCGFKGKRIGDAQFSDVHANFIVNLGSAKASDILTLISIARNECRDKYGIELYCEVRYLDSNCRMVPAHFVGQH